MKNETAQKISKYHQSLLAERIAYRYCKVTKNLLKNGTKNPGKLEPWIEINGIHSFIPGPWEDAHTIEVGPIQKKKIIAIAKKNALRIIKNCAEFKIIQDHLEAMAKEGKDISGQKISHHQGCSNESQST